MDIDPNSLSHYEFHRQLLLASGIQVDIEYQVAYRIGLRVQQIGHLEVRIGPEELTERATAIFRFLPYSPVVTVVPQAARPKSRRFSYVPLQ
ncbi:hypothetical protein CLV84_4251 [Neolewinella xylanilytica]|uniref:Uncharacterized protein n=1 Tax=Neolewinella xylanilytica TaxID=1514080 RepID=A0A2S6HZY8_9BACT|nr:hypothetical protein [Neolewinella xylanilytica]PPK84100.1 hypothetical protein CLV84_4251 [Neolewinella xylanilytica]